MRNALLSAYKKLHIDGSWLGFEQSDYNEPYFCTPVGAEIIGWDNGIHYCFLPEQGETVFCVNPETCCDDYVYPVARSFEDFLRLLLEMKTANVIQQVICWDQTAYEQFISQPDEIAYAARREVTDALDTIRTKLHLEPMADGFAYIKSLQAAFDRSCIHYSDEYYDTLGLERPDGTEPDAVNAMDFAAVEFRFHKND